MQDFKSKCVHRVCQSKTLLLFNPYTCVRIFQLHKLNITDADVSNISAGDTTLEQFPLNPEDSGLEQFEMSDSSSDTTIIPVSNTSTLVTKLR